jgi:hypothetical protein
MFERTNVHTSHHSPSKKFLTCACDIYVTFKEILFFLHVIHLSSITNMHLKIMILKFFGIRVNTPITKHEPFIEHPYSWPMLDHKQLYGCYHISLSLNIW